MKKLWLLIKSPEGMAILSVASFLFAIYALWFYEKNPGLRIEILSNANVYDIHANVGKLEVFYAGEDLRKTKQTLRLITTRLINSGQTNITKNDFDEADPVGFEIRAGRILESPTITGSNDYLVRNVSTSLKSNSQISIRPIILEAGEFIEFQMLVLSPEGVIPSIEPLGKVAGVRRIGVLLPNDISKDRPIWDRITDADSLWIQAARAPIYALFFLFLVALTVGIIAIASVPVQMIKDHRQVLNRKERLESFAATYSPTNTEKKLLALYESGGDFQIRMLYKTIRQLAMRNELSAKISDRVDPLEAKEILRSTYPLFAEEIELAQGDGFLTREGDAFIIDVAVLDEIAAFSQKLGVSLTEPRFDTTGVGTSIVLKHRVDSDITSAKE